MFFFFRKLWRKLILMATSKTSECLVSDYSKVTTIKTVKPVDEFVDIGTDTPVWHRYRLKIMSLSKQVSKTVRFTCVWCVYL